MSVSDSILKAAQNLIKGDRAEDYGDKTITHRNIAELWSDYLGHSVSAHDVAICMILLKIARLKTKHKEDSYIDIAGYAAIAAEIEIDNQIVKKKSLKTLATLMSKDNK
jgi:hypothetical protein|tara:strand:- start:4996 stop:5322 length:327 start_codon:yes stop_codon:yes gene_type:complete